MKRLRKWGDCISCVVDSILRIGVGKLFSCINIPDAQFGGVSSRNKYVAILEISLHKVKKKNKGEKSKELYTMAVARIFKIQAKCKSKPSFLDVVFLHKNFPQDQKADWIQENQEKQLRWSIPRKRESTVQTWHLSSSKHSIHFLERERESVCVCVCRREKRENLNELDQFLLLGESSYARTYLSPALDTNRVFEWLKAKSVTALWWPLKVCLLLSFKFQMIIVQSSAAEKRSNSLGFGWNLTIFTTPRWPK